MNAGGAQILLATNGSPTTRPALVYGAWLAGLLQAPVLLLGVVEASPRKAAVEALLADTERSLNESGIAYHTVVDSGRASLVTARYAGEGNTLTVVGPMGRPTWRRVMRGRTFRRLLEKIQTPLIYVPQGRLPLRRLLLCMGGLAYADSLEEMCVFLAGKTGASITLLHVVEPITMDYPVARQVHEHWREILTTDTPQGRFLRESMEELQASGLAADFKVRHGNTVHEILEEVRQGGYDLVGLGSPYSARSLRHLYMPNVTAEVAESIECPVLTVRQGYGLESRPRGGEIAAGNSRRKPEE